MGGRMDGVLSAVLILTVTVAADMLIDKSIPEGETLLTEEDFRGVRWKRESLFKEDQNVDDSAMYNRNRFEGDILTMISPGAPLEHNDVSNASFLMRNAVRGPYLKWPNARIPYTISTQYTNTGRQRIAAAIDEYHKTTCIQFVPKTSTDLDYVHIVPDEGCYSLVGKVGGKQPVSIGNGCLVPGIIIHELMHSVGFFHEQSRADRDNYVRIVWNNVESGLQDQFDKYSLAMIDHLNTEYDYGSVMHYGPHAFSKNGKATVEPIKHTSQRIGQRVGFSTTDRLKINKLYDCPVQKSDSLGPPLQSSSISFGNLPVSLGARPDNSVQQAISCQDQRRDCEFLAQRGHCTSSYAQMFMSSNCAKSCGQCGEGTTADNTCQDKKPWCSRWADAGLCQLFMFSSYMKSHCTRSCSSC